MSTEIGEKRVPDRQGVIFLIYNNGKVLLEERISTNKAYYGYTIIPGGKFEQGVDLSHEDALKREVLEECGVTINDFVLLDRYLQTTITNHLYDVSAFLVTNYNGEITNPEGKARHLWVDIAEADKYLLFADSRYILSMAKSILSNRQNG